MWFQRKHEEGLSYGRKVRELIQAGRAASAPASARATSRKASPRQRTPVEEEQAASVAAAPRSLTSVEERVAANNPPAEPGKTFDELFDWSLDDDGLF